MKKRVLILCTGNSCRSQMAHGYLNYFAARELEVYSAGLESHGVNARAIAVMKEDSVDISHHTSNTIDEYSTIDFDFVLTVCDNAREKCPYFPAKVKIIHRDFPDPAKATGTDEVIIQHFRRVRDMIREYTNDFVKQYINISS